MITILGVPSGEKKGGSKRAPNKVRLTDRDPPEPQPREGGRGKGKPSQLEDWKSLKPKPPQPRGLVGLIAYPAAPLASIFVLSCLKNPPF